MEKTIIDIDSWERTKLFNFYNSFDNPCYNITFRVPCSRTWDYCKREKKSFFLYSLYVITKSMNEIENFKYRIDKDNNVVLYDVCNVVSPIELDGDMFKEIEFEFDDDLDVFYDNCKKRIALAKSESAGAGENNEDSFLIGCVPWLDFESYTYADYSFKQTTPCLTFGKYKDGSIPLTIKANHSFIDGKHLKRFVERMTELFTAESF